MLDSRKSLPGAQGRVSLAQCTGVRTFLQDRDLHSPMYHSPSTVVHVKSLISSGFSTGLSKEECWLNSAVHLWAFRHTHYYNCDFEDSIAKKRIVTNQRGYYFSQAAKFDLE